MHIPWTKPSAVPPPPVRPVPRPSCERSPREGFFPEKARDRTVYRLVLGCSLTAPRTQPQTHPDDAHH